MKRRNRSGCLSFNFSLHNAFSLNLTGTLFWGGQRRGWRIWLLSDAIPLGVFFFCRRAECRTVSDLGIVPFGIGSLVAICICNFTFYKRVLDMSTFFCCSCMGLGVDPLVS